MGIDEIQRGLGNSKREMDKGEFPELWLLGLPKDSVKEILKELSPECLCITTGCSNEKEGVEFLLSLKDYTGMFHFDTL